MNIEEKVNKLKQKQNFTHSKMRIYMNEIEIIRDVFESNLPLHVLLRMKLEYADKLNTLTELLDNYIEESSELEKMGEVRKIDTQVDEVGAEKTLRDLLSKWRNELSNEFHEWSDEEFAEHVNKFVINSDGDNSKWVLLCKILFGYKIGNLLSAKELGVKHDSI